ncbi:hypothetical protein PGTUg99_030367 [Puccinia graminis f. sp. tritici]|uniref:Uncharacterized protein n=1 Tax=Puccinia graminis f. sp. tritici TaxID=56615 RepID=A0A5B0R932_PUCGR|nr:hypothetical protein PGTUg99_030367 [Puccinia graminis f. sp. tritici]
MARRYHPPQSAIHQTDKLASSKTTKASKDNYVSISCSCPMIPVPVSPNPPELARTACFGIETLFLTASLWLDEALYRQELEESSDWNLKLEFPVSSFPPRALSLHTNLDG